MTLTEIQSQVSKTATFLGTALDCSAISGDWTIKLNVSALTAGQTVRFVFLDSTAGSAYIAGPAFSIKGEIENTYDKVKSFKKQDFPDFRLGVDAQSGVKLQLLNISGGSVTYRSWIEY